MFLAHYIKETESGTYKAEIHEDNQGYHIEYYNPDNTMFKKETYGDRSVVEISRIAERWINSIGMLNG